MATLLICVWILQLLFRDMACVSVPFVQETQNFISVRAGETVDLNCSVPDGQTDGSTFWYKQSLNMTQTVTTLVKISSQTCNDILCKLFIHIKANLLKHTNKDGSEDEIADSGIYHCIRKTHKEIIVLKSITVIVKNLTLIEQTESEVTKKGSSVNLKCTVQKGNCEEQPRVHWFKESATGVLNHKGGDSWCERNKESPSESCVFNLLLNNVSSEQMGTYYCAVAACGQVLFGNGTKLIAEDGASYAVYVLSGALVFSVALIVVLALSLYILKKKYNGLRAVMERARASMSTGPNEEDREADGLHYAAVRINPPSKQRNTVSTDCVYSTVQPH